MNRKQTNNRINETKIWIFGKIIKMIFSWTKANKKIHITNIRTERGDINPDPTDFKRII